MSFEEIFRTFVTGGASPRTQVIALLGSAFLLWLILRQIKHNHLKPGYAIGWLFVAGVVFVFSLFSPLLTRFAGWLDIAYAPAAFLLILVGGLFLLALHFSFLVTKYDRQIRDLIQEHALLRHELTAGPKKRQNREE